MRLKVTYFIDATSEDVDENEIYNGIDRVGGYDLTIEEAPDAPPVSRGRLKREPKA